jgi:malate dehydrogenase (oxaloacetate-decarboxylating)
MNFSKEEIAQLTNKERRTGSLAEIITGSDVFIGLSAGGMLTPQMVRQMAPNPLVFALANPVPEITPDLACEAGALAVATGRSDFPNQVNNSLAFPGVFRGALDVKASAIDDAMKIAAARAIAELVDDSELSTDFLIPDSLDLRVPPRVAAAVAQAAIAGGLARNPLDPREVEMRCRDLVYEGTVGL